MGIAIEPIDSGPCVDSDCYYARGETLTWWPSASPPAPAPEPLPRWDEAPRIDPPSILLDEPLSGSGDSTPISTPVLLPPFFSPPSSSPPSSPPPSSTSPTAPDPLPPVASDDPLYSVIGQLLGSRQPTTQPEPIVLAPPPSNPSLAIWIMALAVVGVLGYAWLQRR